LYYTCFSNGTGDMQGSFTPSNNINSDPAFVDPALYDYRIKGISPCADAGFNDFNSLAFDIRGTGFGRKLLKTDYLSAGPIDMGAYEYNSNTDPIGCIAPTFTACPNPIGVPAEAAFCSAVVSYSATAAGEPAPGLSYAFTGDTEDSGTGTGSGSTFNKGITTVVVTATNDCGSAACTFTVTVSDTEPPAITTCPPPQSVFVGANCQGVVPDFTASTVATDNCGAVATITQAPTAGSQVGPGVYPITITVTDGASLTATCPTTLTVNLLSISGTLKYHKAYASSGDIPLNGVILQLLDEDNDPAGGPVTTSGGGQYNFGSLCPGAYTIQVTENNKLTGGVNSTDAAQVNSWFSNTFPVQHARFLAGDVSNNYFINTTEDAISIQK
jgi:hypothetical protein